MLRLPGIDREHPRVLRQHVDHEWCEVGGVADDPAELPAAQHASSDRFVDGLPSQRGIARRGDILQQCYSRGNVQACPSVYPSGDNRLRDGASAGPVSMTPALSDIDEGARASPLARLPELSQRDRSVSCRVEEAN